MIYDITPVPKPRMTQRDRWQKRPAVVRYRNFCDQVREAGVAVDQQGAAIIFVIPMPKSWSKKKRVQMAGAPHQQKPDLDNLIKALLDAVHDEDCAVWSLAAEKRWGSTGGIIITGSNA